jgi:hypothetical protein
VFEIRLYVLAITLSLYTIFFVKYDGFELQERIVYILLHVFMKLIHNHDLLRIDSDKLFLHALGRVAELRTSVGEHSTEVEATTIFAVRILDVFSVFCGGAKLLVGLSLTVDL